MGIKSADQITIIDVTDAYSVMLTSEAYTFIGDTSGVPVGQTCSTEVVAFCGTSQCNSVNVTAGDIVCPTGITAKVENSGTTKVKITFTTAAVISTACEATIEQTITASGECSDLGVVKWYKGNNQSTPVAISKTYTISAADVLNSEIITVQLEK